MPKTRTRSKPAGPANAAGPKPGRAAGKSIDEIEFSEEDARFLRQAAAYDKAFPPGAVDEETGERYVPKQLADAMLLALRFASTNAGAPADCRNRACRNGHCHLQIDAAGDGVCQGGIRDGVVDNAAMLLAFLGRIGVHYLDGGRK